MKVKAAELVLDTALYPRSSINHIHIDQMMQALRVGRTLPLILVTEKNDGVPKNIIVDGVHRLRAYQRLYGEGVEIVVETRSFESLHEVYLASLELNSDPKRAFSPHEIAAALIKGVQMGIGVSVLANRLAITEGRARRYIEKRSSPRMVETVAEDGSKVTTKQIVMNNVAQTSGGEDIALKSPLLWLAGYVLTPAQEEANQRSDGMSLKWHLGQTYMLLTHEAVDVSNEDERELMVEVRKEIGEWLKRHKPVVKAGSG